MDRGLRVFFERDLEDALLQQEVGDHLLELLVVLLERAQALGVRVGHHPELLLPAVEGRGGDVELPADLGLATAGLVLADGPYPGLLRVAFLAHLMRYVLGWGGLAIPALSVQLAHTNGTHPRAIALYWTQKVDCPIPHESWCIKYSMISLVFVFSV